MYDKFDLVSDLGDTEMNEICSGCNQIFDYCDCEECAECGLYESDCECLPEDYVASDDYAGPTFAEYN